MNIASYLSWYKHNTQGVQGNDVHKVQVSERYSFSNLKLQIRTKRTTITYIHKTLELAPTFPSVQSCCFMPRHVRRQTYIYTITFTVLNTLGLVYVKSYGTSKIAERVDSTYLRGTWLKTKKYQILVYLRYV